jgi:hypothetical protein
MLAVQQRLCTRSVEHEGLPGGCCFTVFSMTFYTLSVHQYSIRYEFLKGHEDGMLAGQSLVTQMDCRPGKKTCHVQ